MSIKGSKGLRHAFFPDNDIKIFFNLNIHIGQRSIICEESLETSRDICFYIPLLFFSRASKKITLVAGNDCVAGLGAKNATGVNPAGISASAVA